ncbi:MAG: hypothetical protein IPK82_30375 [Polyangiaceae bacterium]|nr:hypothetical protein [Polyangiaceae bacterium]
MDASRWAGFGVVPVLFAAGMFGSSACGSTVVTGPGGGGEGGATTGTDSATTNTTNTGGAPTTSTSISTTATTTTTTTTSTTTTTTTTGTGGADPWAGPVEALKELDLGDIGFGVQTSFPVPDKTLGLTVQVEGVAADSVVGVYRLRPPVGSSVIINFAMTGKSTQVFGGLGVIGAANPQSDTVDAWPVKAGAWKVTTGSDGNAGDQAHVRVWVRRTEDGQFHGGVVDVNLWVVPGVASSNYMSQVLDAFFPYAGLDIGTFTNLSADAAFGTIGSVDEYYSMLKATGGMQNEPAINLFVVDDFADAAYGGAIGVAGGVPGSPMRHGTRQSGLAYEPSGDPNYDATVLMHEIGHVAGLFHTTEFQITETDPLSDTPECDAGTIQNNPGQCSDKSNTMFPIAYGATAFTNAQLNVIRGSALYRGN